MVFHLVCRSYNASDFLLRWPIAIGIERAATVLVTLFTAVLMIAERHG